VVLGGWTIWWQVVLGAATGAAIGGTIAGSLWPPRRALAHLGITPVLVGALGGTASTQQTVGISAGRSLDVVGHEIENLGASLLSDDPPVIGARIRIDGQTIVEPSLTVFVDRALRLPEVATKRGLVEDVQIILRSADDDGSAVITVNSQPLTQFVWFGATLVALAMIVPGRPRRRATSSTHPPVQSQPNEPVALSES